MAVLRGLETRPDDAELIDPLTTAISLLARIDESNRKEWTKQMFLILNEPTSTPLTVISLLKILGNYGMIICLLHCSFKYFNVFVANIVNPAVDNIIALVKVWQICFEKNVQKEDHREELYSAAMKFFIRLSSAAEIDEQYNELCISLIRCKVLINVSASKVRAIVLTLLDLVADKIDLRSLLDVGFSAQLDAISFEKNDYADSEIIDQFVKKINEL